MPSIPIQQELRPALPNVYGPLDYRQFRDILIKIDEMLTKSDLEQMFIEQALEQEIKLGKLNDEQIENNKGNYYHKLSHALRCNIARHLTGESYRAFSLRLADSPLFQWFTKCGDYGSCQAMSKSSLERYEKYFDEEQTGEQIRKWLNEFSNEKQAHVIGLHKAVSFKKTFTDTTCVKSDIHFPVDWVLLRDGVRSLLLAIQTIRAQGLKHRICDPKEFLKQMNKLCIEMTHTRRKKDGRKNQKIILRKMKSLSRCIAKHATRYRALLKQEWQETNWSEAQANQVICRIDSILELLPQAIKQAHERIIGGRLVESSDKILSLYDKDCEVIVRGKAGNEVEFGQRFVLTEQEDGLIIDWKLFSKSAPHDHQLFQPAMKRIQKSYGQIDSSCADRAFSSPSNEAFLKSENIYNGICPKSPRQLQEKLTDPLFLSLQVRRSQSEGRIGIFKNVFLGKPLRSRITLYKRHAINWCVLTHNLWVLSRKALADELSLLPKAA